MSDLSRTLTEAATNAVDKAEAEVYTGRRLARADLRYMGEASVGAVLATLAGHFDGLDAGDCHPADALRRLAGEIREGGS